jgi:hypothetical protein
MPPAHRRLPAVVFLVYYLDMDTGNMRKALESEARSLRVMHGPIQARHFTINPNSRTVSDIRNGDVYAWFCPDWLTIGEENVIIHFPIAKA